MELRGYQQRAIEASLEWMGNNLGNPLVVLPTGAGKSLVIAGLIKHALTEWPDTRIVVVTHVKELIEQNCAQAKRYWPDVPAGIYSAGIGRREEGAQVLFCGIQSVYGKAAQIGWTDLVLIDEAHLVPKDGFGRYRTFLGDLGSTNNRMRILGLTATPFRTDSGLLHEGDDRIFHDIAYDADLVQLIKDGYLSPVVAKGSKVEIDTDDVHIRGGEFIAGELEAAAMAPGLVEAATSEIIARGQDRKSWLVFCCGIKHAEAVAAELREAGVNVATVFGDTDKAERDRVVKEFKAGAIRCIVNVSVLTTGFDAPQVDLIALLRPTCSPGLFVQMAGRGFRLAEGKTNCLLLDFGGNFMRHGSLDMIEPVSMETGDGSGDQPVKTCPKCFSLIAAAHRQCPDCGHEFHSPKMAKHHERPAEVVAIAGLEPKKVITQAVASVEYFKHQREGKLPSMQVNYRIGKLGMHFSEWVCFEHEGYAGERAARWWLSRAQAPVPDTVDEALRRKDEIAQPLTVTVEFGGQWPEIKKVICKVEPGIHEPDAPPPTPHVDYSEVPF
jgi:DNA repair protein RadD